MSMQCDTFAFQMFSVVVLAGGGICGEDGEGLAEHRLSISDMAQ